MGSGVTSIDLQALGEWMDGMDLPAGPITGLTELGGGTQNILLRFSRGGECYVLRHPPLHKRPNSDETMRREARVLQALAGSDVPHPRLIAACPDTNVLGSAFYLMEPVDGVNPTMGLPLRYRSEPSWRWELGLAMSDGAAAVAAVDYNAVGLGDLGRTEGYLERQVARWQRQLESYADLDGYPGPEIPALVDVTRWLEENRPSSSEPGLIHGDYHFANVLCHVDSPGLAAIVDWELTTIGDPLVDLGGLLATWPAEDAPVPILRLDPWSGFPSRADLIDRYRERSTRDLSSIGWYEVLVCYKLGIILEGTYARSCAGKAPKDVGEQLHATTLALFDRAVAKLRRAEA